MSSIVLGRIWMAMVALILLQACSTPSLPPPIAASSSSPNTASKSIATATSESSAQCAVTPYSNERPSDGNVASFTKTWYGNDALWAGLASINEGTWYTGGSGQKVLWYRSAPGKLTVEGQRLDALATPLIAHIPEGYGDSGYQASELFFPNAGCWEVVGRAGAHELRFIVSIRPGAEHPRNRQTATQVATDEPFANPTFRLTARQAEQVMVMMRSIQAYNGGRLDEALTLLAEDVGWSDCDYKASTSVVFRGKAQVAEWLRERIADHDQLIVSGLFNENPDPQSGANGIGVTFSWRTSDSLQQLGFPNGLAPNLSAKVVFTSDGPVLISWFNNGSPHGCHP